MVLFKRRTVVPVENKAVPTDDDQMVWYIPETKEFFCTYDEYLARLDFYQQKKFICELSGTSCLTFFDAMKKEENEKQQLLMHFPEALKKPILEKVQFSFTTRLDQLVDEIYLSMKELFFLGEQVSVRYEEQRIKAVVVKADHKTGLYQVDDGKRVLEGYSNQIQRDKKLISKPALRAFIKHSAFREAWPGSPWMVREEYANRYDISTKIPESILTLKAESERAASHHQSMPTMSSNSHTGQSGSGSHQSSGHNSKHSGKDSSKWSSYKQLNQDYAESRSRALKELEERIPSEYRNDDIFIFAEGEGPLDEIISERDKNKPWPEWHHDTRLLEIEKANKLGHLFEVWLFSQFFSKLIGFTDYIQKFDDFVEGIISKEPSQQIEKLHECVMSMLVDKRGTKLITAFPESDDSEESGSDNDDDQKSRSDEEPHSDEEMAHESEEKEEEGSGESENESEHKEGPLRKKQKTSNKPEKERTPDNTWISRIGTRDYADGGWQHILAEILRKLCHSTEWKTDTQEVVSYFFEDDTTVSHGLTDEKALELYQAMSVPNRVHCLMLLIRILYSSTKMREFLDSQYETASKLRRHTHSKELKQYRDELKSAQKLLNLLSDPNKDPKASDNNQVESLAEELNLETPVSVDSVKSLVTKLLENVDQASNSVNETAKTLARMDNQRLKLLGKDKFFNRYWWMDSNGVDQTGQYYMGRLWVQGPSAMDLEFLQSEDYAHHFIEFRKAVLSETALIKEEADKRLSEREMAANSNKIIAKKERPLKKRIVSSEDGKSSPKLKFINQVSGIPATARRQGIGRKPTKVLSDLSRIERRISELMMISKHNGGLLCADDTVELRQMEADLLEIKKNSGSDKINETIEKIEELFASNFPTSYIAKNLSQTQQSVASAPATPVTKGDISIESHADSSHQDAQYVDSTLNSSAPTGAVTSQGSSDEPIITGVSTTGVPSSGVPLTSTGVPSSGVPSSGVPSTGVPSTVPSSGVPSSGVPSSGVPAPGVPTNGVPSNGMPVPGVPSNGMPVPGVPSNGVPAPGMPAPGVPTPRAPVAPGTSVPPRPYGSEERQPSTAQPYYDSYQMQYPQPGYQLGYQAPPNAPQQAVQWVIQQTSQGPMLFAVPIQQYQLMMQQYNTSLGPETNDAYGAYMQQLSMQQALAAQQMQYQVGYYPQGQMAPPVMGYPPNMGYPQNPPVAARHMQQPMHPSQIPMDTQSAPTQQAPIQPQHTPAALQPPHAQPPHAQPLLTQPPVQPVHPSVAQLSEQPQQAQQRETPPKPYENTQTVDSKASQLKPENVKEEETAQEPRKESLNEKTADVNPHENNMQDESGVKKEPELVTTDSKNRDDDNSNEKKDEDVVMSEPMPSSVPIAEKSEIEVSNDDEAKGQIEIKAESPVANTQKVHLEAEAEVRPMDIFRKIQHTDTPLGFNEWRFYESPTELEQLLSYLSSGGRREVKLASAIRKVHHEISSVMKTRLKDLGIHTED